MRTLQKILAVSWLASLVIACNIHSTAHAEEQRSPVVVTDQARALHARSLVIDGHNDMPWEIRKSGSDFSKLDISQPQASLHTDIPRLRAGGVGAQFWSVWVPVDLGYRGEALATTLEQIELVKRMIQRYPDTFELALSTDDIERIHQEGKIASLIGVEGGHCIQESLQALEKLYDLGARYMTLTHTDSLNWADSATDEAKNGGLTPFGEDVIRKMNELGMLVDLSHVSPDTMNDVLDISAVPVIFSHSSARAVADHPRNVPDEVLQRLRQQDGVVMVNFYSGFIVPESTKICLEGMLYEQGLRRGEDTESIEAKMIQWRKTHPYPRGTIHDLLDHIDHIAQVAGPEHVGIGSDFDGVSVLPEQLEDVSCYPTITQGLIDRGYSDEQLQGILGGNLMRVFRARKLMPRDSEFQNRRKPILSDLIIMETETLPEREAYARFRVSPADPSALRSEDVERTLLRIAESSAARLKVERFAESYQGRPIYLASIGTGPRRVLLWSQMHGDESTHTAVLLDLLSYLTKYADEPAVADILAGTTLFALPMLCPDGAAAGTRYNAQHIDVNRDALRLETPEGRALMRAVETVRPEFGFNLHNQNARTAIGMPPRPAAVALMAPPLDAALTENSQIRAAKQLSACFVKAVRESAAGMISRYDADFMPWSFGERIQAMGIVTVLVEAGGWPGPDPTPIVEVHFDGLVATLRAITDDSYRDADPGDYDRLPRANELKLYDVVIVGAHVLDVDCCEPVRADLGINHSHGTRLARSQRPDGKIVDLGDLGTATGKTVIAADGCLILPGRIAYLHDWRLGHPLDPNRLNSLLASGVTTIIGRANSDRNEAVDAPMDSFDLPVNWAFVAAAAAGENPRVDNNFAEHVAQTWQDYQRFGLATTRGRIRREYSADLAVYDAGTGNGVAGPLRRVIVAGETVWADGKLTGANAGSRLRCAEENRLC